MTGTLYIAIGIGLMVLSLYIELRHKHIWESCKPKRRRLSSGFIGYVTRPNKFSYAMNIYLIWPAMFTLGVFCVLVGMQLSGIKLW